MKETFTVDICGRKEALPVLQLESGPKIAFFNLHGNVTLTEYCAEKLAQKIAGKADVLGHCVARNLGQPLYAVARKSKKLYMQDGISVTVQSITTKEEQHLYLSAHDAALLSGKRVAIVDDVVSTGGSIEAMRELVRLAGGQVAVQAAVLAEGDAKDRADVVYLAHIPLL